MGRHVLYNNTKLSIGNSWWNIVSLFIIMRIFTSLLISLLQVFIFDNILPQISSFIVTIILLEIILFQTNLHYYSCNHILSAHILPILFSQRIYCLLISLLYALNLHIYYSIFHCSNTILQSFTFMSHLQ